ncbi:DUF1175 family protein [Caldimonas brevitalea]|uniref:DUF1175 domain-containing protein n=1 Tax=Caldimonas brevitalea TaxID=413882 RepID=A0A0G3BTQ5_9BURK|nr:DUF1175 family protein [Caldimonas brevitalea]AKJ29915.1 hypothetical protein AAW51_3224 [Caldimonas brevitalea]
MTLADGSRRRALLTMAGSCATALLTRPAYAASRSTLRPLDAEQSMAFRRWFVALVDNQVSRPSPRWVHRDCAGLVRFAVAEAMRPHTSTWLQAMGWNRQRPRPPELNLADDQRGWARAWQLPEGDAGAYAPAIAIVQHNTRHVGRQRTTALPGDLLFFDQGDDQHLMVWTGRHIAYHTGAEPQPGDNGLRRLRWEQLLAMPDTRWRPLEHNRNFAGLFRFGFLSH